MKIKLRHFGLVCLISLMVVPLLGCELITSINSPSALTREQAIAIIQISGLPSIEQYHREKVGEEAAQGVEIGYVTPGAQWAAEYRRGDKTWVIQGTVITEQWGECLTTWTLNEADSKLALIGFGCD